MNELRRRFQVERPALPEGFEARHDALLHTLTQREETVMKRKLSIGLVALCVLLLLACGMALAAGLGVFGQFAGEHDDRRLESLEQVSESYAEQASIGALSEHFPAIQFAASQAHYDGQSLYIAYTLSGPMTTLEYLDPDTAKGIEWEFTPEDGLFTDWETALSPEDYALLARRLETDGRVLAVVHSQFVGDGADLADGTYINPSRSDMRTLPDGGLAAYTEFEFPLPEAAQDQDKLEIVFTLLRNSYLYYQDETGGYYRMTYGERIEPLPLPVTILKNGAQRRLTGEGEFADYGVSVTAVVSDVDVKAQCTVRAPESWVTAWDTWDDEADYLFGYGLYADGKKIRDIGFSCFASEGNLLFLLEFEHPGGAAELVLKPTYSKTGERAGEDIPLTQ